MREFAGCGGNDRTCLDPYCAGSYTTLSMLPQYCVITYTEKKKASEEEWIYVYVSLIHSAVHLKVTQHRNSTRLQ